jgi:hypothetical protein
MIHSIAVAANPKGIVSFSPGLRGTSYPGYAARVNFNPNGVASFRSRRGHNPVGVEIFSTDSSQGSSCLATLGFEPESLWDSELECIQNYFPHCEPLRSPRLCVNLASPVL